MTRILAILLLCAWDAGAATTTNVPTANLVDVQNAVNAMSNGDTVVIPAGSANWADTLNVDKLLTIQGAGVNSTVITYTGGDQTEHHITVTGNGGDTLLRITGISFDGNSHGGGIKVWGPDKHNVRVDHCSFTDCCYTTYVNSYVRGVWFQGHAIYGVIDHNTFTNCSTYAENDGNNAEDWNESTQFLGTTNCMVIEDNFFRQNSSCAGPDQQFYVSNGGRVLFRNNVFYDDDPNTSSFWDCHGNNDWPISDFTSLSYLRGTVYAVVSSNTIYKAVSGNGGKMFYIRGGVFVLDGNTINVDGTTYAVAFTDEEIWYCIENATTCFFTWPRIDQITNSWIANNTYNGGPLTQAHFYRTANQHEYPPYSTALDNCIVEGRDVFFTNSIPAMGYNNPQISGGLYGYTPLVYPHPAVSGTPPPITEAAKFTVYTGDWNYGYYQAGSSSNVTMVVSNNFTTNLTVTASVAHPWTITTPTFALSDSAVTNLVVAFEPTVKGATNKVLTFTSGLTAVSRALQAIVYPVVGLAFNATNAYYSAGFADQSTTSNSYVYAIGETTVDVSLMPVWLIGVTITNAGDYVILSTVASEGTGEDSVLVGINAAPLEDTATNRWIPIGIPTGGFKARYVSQANYTNVWPLASGVNKFWILGREPNMRMQDFTFTQTNNPPPPVGSLTLIPRTRIVP